MAIHAEIRRGAGLSRWHVLTGLYAVGFLNGVTWSIRGFSGTDYWDENPASWTAWLAGAAALFLTARAADAPITRRDLVAGLLYIPFILWPEPHVAWFGLTLLALYALFAGPRDSHGRGGTAIVLSMTIAMLWAKIVVHFCAHDLELIDVWLVGAVSPVTTYGNLVPYQHDQGLMIVGWPCTSFANMSLALMLWLTITRIVRPAPRLSEWWNLAGMFATVVAINTARLALMTTSPAVMNVVHNGIGVPIVSFLLLIATCGWALYGVRHELRR